ncbi:MAG: hypothetical protein PHS48_04665 [Bacteroidales bacterium]|nr:hypothetical protein [Bacteroidales bacterium]
MRSSDSFRCFAFLTVVFLGGFFSQPVSGQFLDTFDMHVQIDQRGMDGWSCMTGDGNAKMTLGSAPGSLLLQVDASQDKEGIWWAILKRNIAQYIDLQKLSEPDYEIRVEARIKVSHAPRRVNLSFNTQRTTDFHSDLMEFDIPDTDNYHTISFTTENFDGKPGDQLNVQLAVIDWGLEKYEVAVDYFKAELVDRKNPVADLGMPMPYHPKEADVTTFTHHLKVQQDATVDLRYPDLNFNDWYTIEPQAKAEIVTVGDGQYVLLRWDFSRYKGKKVVGSGLLSLVTQSVQRAADYTKDFGMIHVSEILGGDALWDQKTVTWNSFLQGQPQQNAINSQMIIDNALLEKPGDVTYITISNPVMQRLIDGKTKGIVLLPLGAIQAAFYSSEFKDGSQSASLHFNLESL